MGCEGNSRRARRREAGGRTLTLGGPAAGLGPARDTATAVLRRLHKKLDEAGQWGESKAWRAQAATALRIRRKDVRAAFPAGGLEDVLIVYFDPPTAACEVWCIRVELTSLQPLGDPIRFTQQWAWVEHARAGDWWEEWAADLSEEMEAGRVLSVDAGPTKLDWFE
jgi:hypothetical protein